jgi:hypothetical protein
MVHDGQTNFSGVSELDAARSVSAHSSSSSVPKVTLVIKQTATELSIETRQGGRSETIIYKLDGSESEKPAQDNGPFQWRPQWKGPQLAMETQRNINRATVTINEVFSLDRKAKEEMTVDCTLTVQHGYKYARREELLLRPGCIRKNPLRGFLARCRSRSALAAAYNRAAARLSLQLGPDSPRHSRQNTTDLAVPIRDDQSMQITHSGDDNLLRRRRVRSVVASPRC